MTRIRRVVEVHAVSLPHEFGCLSRVAGASIGNNDIEKVDASAKVALEATCAPEREPFAQIDTLVTKSARRASSKIDDGSTFFVRHVPRAAGMVTTRRMKTLVLGGTRFLGRHIVDVCLANGHSVTIFHRGLSDPRAFPNVEHVIGDRDVS